MTGPVLARYPIDFSTLAKGSWLETGEISDALQLEPDDKHWGLKVVGLISLIRSESGILARQEGQRVRLMTDVEASSYTYRALETATRKQITCAENLTMIDPSQMNEAELRSHDARSRVITATALAANNEKEKQRKIEGLLTNGTILGKLRLTD